MKSVSHRPIFVKQVFLIFWVFYVLFFRANNHITHNINITYNLWYQAKRHLVSFKSTDTFFTISTSLGICSVIVGLIRDSRTILPVRLSEFWRTRSPAWVGLGSRSKCAPALSLIWSLLFDESWRAWLGFLYLFCKNDHTSKQFYTSRTAVRVGQFCILKYAGGSTGRHDE